MKLSRLRQPVIGAFAVLLISGAGVAFAGTGSAPAIAPDTTVSAPGAGLVEAAGTDTDTLQVGDQATADGVADAAAPEGTVAEAAGAEAAGSETNGTEAPGVESDGPGGHADNSGDANADHQYDGNE